MAKRDKVSFERMFRVLSEQYGNVIVEEDGNDVWIKQGEGTEVACILVNKEMALELVERLVVIIDGRE